MLGKVLRGILKERKIPQDKIANELNIAVSTLNGYIMGYRQPNFEMVIKIADYLNVSLDYLFGRVELCCALPKSSQLDNKNAELFERHVKVLQYQKSLLEARIEKSESYEEFKETLQQLVEIEKVIQDKISYIQKLQECTINEVG